MVWAVDALQTHRVHAAARAATDSHGLQRALAATAEEKFDGWVLPSVVQELGAALEAAQEISVRSGRGAAMVGGVESNRGQPWRWLDNILVLKRSKRLPNARRAFTVSAGQCLKGDVSWR